MELVTDNYVVLDMSMSLYENYNMLNHTSPLQMELQNHYEWTIFLRLPSAEYHVLMLQLILR